MVVQWPEKLPDLSAHRLAAIGYGIRHTIHQLQLESRIDRMCRDMCYLDGNDIGSGTYNLYLYTGDVTETVKRLIDLQQSQKIPSGMRIAVAKYKNRDRTDWIYEPVYPHTLKQFDLFDQSGAQALHQLGKSSGVSSPTRLNPQ